MRDYYIIPTNLPEGIRMVNLGCGGQVIRCRFSDCTYCIFQFHNKDVLAELINKEPLKSIKRM